MRQALKVHEPLSRGVFAVVVLISFAVLFAPASDVPHAPPGVDKIVHATLFASLGFSGRWAGIGRAVLAGALVGYGAVSEIVQGLIGRDAAVGDLIADSVGVLLGLLVWRWIADRGRG
jgi:VanZ family protein